MTAHHLFGDVFADTDGAQPGLREVHLKTTAAGDYAVVAAPDCATLTVIHVPHDVSDDQAVRRLNGVSLSGAIPDWIGWWAVRGSPTGKLLRCRRSDDGRGCVTPDLPDWTGECSIGGYR